MPDIPFLPDRETWVRTVRERDNLAARLAQARDENERLAAELRTSQAGWRADQEAGAAEVARLTAALAKRDSMLRDAAEDSANWFVYCEWHKGFKEQVAALRGDTAQATGRE